MKRFAATLATGIALVCPAWAQVAFPNPDSTVQTARPVIGYDFQQPARNAVIIVDGRDMTPAAIIQGNRIEFAPNYDLTPGMHQVEVRGQNFLGLRIGGRWNFIVAGAQQPVPNPPVVSGPPKVEPMQDSTTQQTRPRIQVLYPEVIRGAKLWVDGQEQTGATSISGNALSYQPNQDFNAGRHQVSTQATLASGRVDNYSWTFDVQPPAQPNPNNAFLNLSPPRGARLKSTRPYLAADFPADLQDVRLTLDGMDLTNQAERQPHRIAWNPDYDVQPGQHRARVQGRLPNGQYVSTDWDFVLDSGGVNPNQPGGTVDFDVMEPTSGERVPKLFEVTGHAPAGSTVRVVLRDLPRRATVKQFSGRTDQNGEFAIPVSASWANRGVRLEVEVTAIDARTRRPVGSPYRVELIRR